MKISPRPFSIGLVMVLLVLTAMACGGQETVSPTSPSPTTTTPTTTVTPQPGNHPPVIQDFAAEEVLMLPEEKTAVSCTASDPDGDPLMYFWLASDGELSTTEGDTNWTYWTAPVYTGDFTISITVSDGRGGSDSASISIPVLENRPPVIRAIDVASPTLQRSQTTTISCLAEDPDGDSLSYVWLADGGQITGSGSVVTWNAPATDGTYEIRVQVKDSKGTTVGKSTTITVKNPEGSTIIYHLPAESGSVDANGTLNSLYLVGDTDKDVGIRAYFSFDISGLAGAEIKEATLSFKVKDTINNPWFIPPFLHVDPVRYGERALEPGDFEAIKTTGAELGKYNSEPPGEIDVRFPLDQAILGSRTRYQVMLRMASGSNNNGQADYIEFSEAKIEITFVK